MNQSENKKFWDEQALKFSGHQVSWWDINMKNIEINTISKFIEPDDYVLDIGCSNGDATMKLHEITGASFLGIDYSETSIQQAKKWENEKLKFEHLDLLMLKEKDRYNKVITIRCLINLIDEKSLSIAFENIWASLKPGGLFIMCEVFTGAFNNLNRLRETFGLQPLAMPEYNRYISENDLPLKLKGMFSIEQIIKHSSLYYIGTRLFQYLCMNDEPAGHDTELHRFFGRYGFETNHSGDFGPNKVYLLKKL